MQTYQMVLLTTNLSLHYYSHTHPRFALTMRNKLLRLIECSDDMYVYTQFIEPVPVYLMIFSFTGAYFMEAWFGLQYMYNFCTILGTWKNMSLLGNEIPQNVEDSCICTHTEWEKRQTRVKDDNTHIFSYIQQ